MARKYNNARCDCGRPATKRKGNYMICDFCFRCEERGVSGGPTGFIEKRAAKIKERNL